MTKRRFKSVCCGGVGHVSAPHVSLETVCDISVNVVFAIDKISYMVRDEYRDWIYFFTPRFLISTSAMLILPAIHIIYSTIPVWNSYLIAPLSPLIDRSTESRCVESDVNISFEWTNSLTLICISHSSPQTTAISFASSIHSDFGWISTAGTLLKRRPLLWDSQDSGWNTEPYLKYPTIIPQIKPICPFSTTFEASEKRKQIIRLLYSKVVVPHTQ